MGNRAECPVCEGYTSAIWLSLNKEADCPDCGCPYEILDKWNNVRDCVEGLREKKIEKNILKQCEEVNKENLKLKARLNNLYSLICGDDNPLAPFIQAKQILEQYNNDSSECLEQVQVPLRFIVNLYQDQKISESTVFEVFDYNFGVSAHDMMKKHQIGRYYCEI